MHRRQRVVVGAFICVAAVVAPILVSLRIAWNQGFADERREGTGYATEIVRRAEETGNQFGSAIHQLNTDKLTACSPAELDLMRQMDLGSTYIQMVGRISGDELKCTSLGTSAPIAVGGPTLITSHGVAEYTNFKFSEHQAHRLTLIARDGVAVAIDPRLVIDVPTEGDSVFLGVLVPLPRSTRD